MFMGYNMKLSRKILLISALAVVIGVTLFLFLTYNLEPENALKNKNPLETLPTAKGMKDEFQLTMTLENTTYTLGETVSITLVVTNTSNQTLSYVYGEPGGGFGYQVLNSTKSVIYSVPVSSGMSFISVTQWLDANASQSTNFQWEQTGVSGAGTYYIVGQLLTDTFTITTKPLPITIGQS